MLDMFEPQDHPNDFRVPGGPPTPPYDNAGWTLAMQMGVQFDRVLDAVTGPLEKIARELAREAGGAGPWRTAGAGRSPARRTMRSSS